MNRAYKILLAAIVSVALAWPAFAQNGAAQVGNSAFDSLNSALRVDAVATGGGGGPSSSFLNLDQLLNSVYDSTHSALKVNIVTGLPCSSDASGSITCTATGTNQDITLAPSGTGASVIGNLEDKGGQVYNVKAYGATGDGTTDDTSAVEAAYAAAAADSTVYFPAGTYALSSAIDLPVGVTTRCTPGTILLFTGATDGLVWPANGVNTNLKGCAVETSNASGGDALNLSANSPSGSTRLVVSDVEVLAAASGRWAYGLYADSLEVADFFHFGCIQSATVCIHLQDSTNAVNFYGTNIVGSSGTGTVERGIENSDTASAIENNFFGGTIEGYFADSLINLSGVGDKFWGFHFENTNSSPADGADIVADGGNNVTFSGVQGGSFDIGPTTAMRNFNLLDSEIESATISNHVESDLVAGVRGSVTDNAYSNVNDFAVSSSTGQSAESSLTETVRVGARGTTLSGTSAGSVTWSPVFQGNDGGGLGLVTLYFNGYENTTSTAQTISPPSRAWNYTPTSIGACPSGLSLSTLQITLPASMSAAFTGQCVIVGY